MCVHSWTTRSVLQAWAPTDAPGLVGVIAERRRHSPMPAWNSTNRPRPRFRSRGSSRANTPWTSGPARKSDWREGKKHPNGAQVQWYRAYCFGDTELAVALEPTSVLNWTANGQRRRRRQPDRGWRCRWRSTPADRRHEQRLRDRVRPERRRQSPATWTYGSSATGNRAAWLDSMATIATPCACPGKARPKQVSARQAGAYVIASVDGRDVGWFHDPEPKIRRQGRVLCEGRARGYVQVERAQSRHRQLHLRPFAGGLAGGRGRLGRGEPLAV